METYNLYNKGIDQSAILTVNRYKNGNVKNWRLWTNLGLFLADNKTSILVIIDLFKVWDFKN